MNGLIPEAHAQAAGGAAAGSQFAPLLMTEPDAASAFRRFEALRRPRVDRVRKTSDFNGFAYHMEWPFSLARNVVLMAQVMVIATFFIAGNLVAELLVAAIDPRRRSG